MITEAMVSEGIRNGSIRFVKDPNSEHGTVCQIGDNWLEVKPLRRCSQRNT